MWGNMVGTRPRILFVLEIPKIVTNYGTVTDGSAPIKRQTGREDNAVIIALRSMF